MEEGMEQEKECEFYSRMEREYHVCFAAFGVMASTKDCGTDIIDLAEVKKRCNDVFRFLELQDRFLKLNGITKINVSYPNMGSNGYRNNPSDGFEVFGHKFDTLDEVERCIKNKAFL
jgi:hypothetical protein